MKIRRFLFWGERLFLNHFMHRYSLYLACMLFATSEMRAQQREASPAAISPYLQVGGARYQTAIGYYDAFAFSLGAEYRITPWLSLDAGFTDFGTAHTENVPLFAVLEIKGDGGLEMRRRAGYLLPTLRWTPFRWLSLAMGVGPARTQTRVRSYGYLFRNPKVASYAQDETHLEYVGKLTADFRVSPEWSVSVQALGVRSAGYSTNYENLPFRNSNTMESVAGTVGVRYTPLPSRRGDQLGPWSVRAGPVVSHLSYHANYQTTPFGYDIALRRKVIAGLFLEVGHTEYGTSRKRPRHEDGTPLRTPPFNAGYANGDLQINLGSSYCLLGAQYELSPAWTLEAAAGAARSVASFEGIIPVFLTGRYLDIVDRTHAIGDFRVTRRIKGDWHASLGVRYTEFAGPQITFPAFEPDFGNTNVRIWTIMPQLTLKF